MCRWIPSILLFGHEDGYIWYNDWYKCCMLQLVKTYIHEYCSLLGFRRRLRISELPSPYLTCYNHYEDRIKTVRLL